MQAISIKAEDVAKRSMIKAAKEASSKLGSPNISVSVDGTWQKRGFSSRNGVVTCLSVIGKHEGNKVIDTETRSSFCAKCVQQNNDNTKLSTIAKGHECAKNHDSSPGAMEGAGALVIFQRSESLHELKYTKYLGDGDSKAYKTVVDSRVYGETVIDKLECTGHIQKRMGKGLMNIVKENKGKKFVVDREGNQLAKSVANKSRAEKMYIGAGGVGRLSQKAIKSIQGHYGAAIRENQTIVEMKKAIWDIFNHRSGNHTACPAWCCAVKDPARANKSKLPPYVCELIRPVFERLASDELLAKCTHGGTQNANESFHHCIWARCPKTKFSGAQRIRLATAVATVTFNEGEIGLLEWFDAIGLGFGVNHLPYAQSADMNRVDKADKAVLTKTKRKRQYTSINADPEYDPGNC